MSASYDLTGLRRGNSFRRTFRFKDTGGDPIDLSGSALIFVAEAGSVRVRKSTEDGSLAMPDPTAGEITLNLAPADDPPPLKWSDLKYVLWHQGGSEHAKEETHA